AAVDIILIAGGQGPALNTGTTDSEYDLLRSGSAARADCNAAAIRASAAGGGRIISGAVAAGIAVALADSNVRVTAALITLGRHYHIVVVAEVQAFAAPEINVVGEGDGARDIAETLLGRTDAEVLVEGGSVAFNGRLIHPLTATHVVGGAVALEAAVINTAITRRWIVRAVAFDNVVLNQRTSGPAIKCEVGVLIVGTTVVTGIVNHLGTAAGVPAFSAYPVIGVVGPLRSVTTTRVQCHGCTARIFPE